MSISAVILLALFAPAAATAGQIIRDSFKGVITKPVALPYLLHLPDGYHDPANARTTYPLILFLHGAGERGNDLNKLANLGPLAYAARAKGFPFLVLAPQCPVGQAWKPDELIALLDEMQKKYRINPNALYLTGHSMGGAGAWATAMEYPERFAAVAPLAGRAIPLLGGKLWKTPIWVFHGNRDEVVPFTQSKEMVDMLKGMGNDKLKFTVLEGAGHAIENDIYNRAELYDWFMQHRRGN